MTAPSDLRAELLSRLDAAQDQWSTQQFKTFAVMCYRTIDPFLSDEAAAAVSWVVSHLKTTTPDHSLESVVKALQWNVMDPDAGRTNENRFSVEVLKLLEDTPLAAAKAAVVAVSKAADLQALYARDLAGYSEPIAEFNKRMALSQIVGLLEKIEAGALPTTLLP